MTSDKGCFSGKIAVVGSGAVGCYYGAKLATQNPDVHFLMRSDYDHVEKHGLRILSDEGDVVLSNPFCYRSTTEIGPCDLVVIALKATDNEVLKAILPPLVKPDTILLTLQNGLGNEAFLGEAFGPDNVVGGLCFVCLNRTSPGVVEHFSQGAVSLGEYRRPALPRTHSVAELFRRGGIDCSVMEDLMEARWRKLAWNIPFNGLPIVLELPSVAEIMESPEKKGRARALMDEVIAIAKTQDIEIESEYLDLLMQRTLQMGPYKPSSLLDYLGGRPMEVEAIWGEPFRVALEHQVAVPHLEALYRQLLERAHLQSPDS